MNLRLFPARYLGRTRRVLRTLGATFAFLTPAIAAAAQMDGFVVRFTTTGAFDTSWNGSGVTQSTNPNDDFAQDVAIDSFGRIVTCGGIRTGTLHLLVGRFTPTGQVDTSFGLGGVNSAGNPNNNVHMRGCTVDASNRVLVVAEDETDPTAAWVIRFNANGVLDGSFGFAGHSRVAVPGAQVVSLSGIEVASGGKIGIVGTARPNSSTFPKLLVAQLNSNGALDTTFDGDGVSLPNFAVNDTGLAYDTSGRAVVLAVKLTPIGAPDSLLLLRFTAAGTVDSSFGGGNISLTFSGFSSYTSSRVAIDSAGRAVVAGHAHAVDPQDALVTARFTSSGVLDTGWNGTGKRVTSVPAGVRFRAIAVGSNGKVTVGGFHDFLDSSLDDGRTVLVRYTSTGALDSGFGSSGILISTLPNQVAGALQGMALDASGRTVVVGFNFH